VKLPLATTAALALASFACDPIELDVRDDSTEPRVEPPPVSSCENRGLQCVSSDLMPIPGRCFDGSMPYSDACDFAISGADAIPAPPGGRICCPIPSDCERGGSTCYPPDWGSCPPGLEYRATSCESPSPGRPSGQICCGVPPISPCEQFGYSCFPDPEYKGQCEGGLQAIVAECYPDFFGVPEVCCAR
jgi:hypothetical protein